MQEQLTPEKWEELKTLYGDNARFMIEQLADDNTWFDIADYAVEITNYDDGIVEVLVMGEGWSYFPTNKFRIKQSAELPFNLERAKAGDEVLFNKKLLENADFSNAEKWKCSSGQGKIIGFKLFNKEFDCPISLLTMKYPPKVQQIKLNE
jgi:hypothetical protein